MFCEFSHAIRISESINEGTRCAGLSSGDGAAPTVCMWSTCTGDCELRCARCVLRSGPLPTSIVLVDIHLFWSAAVFSYCPLQQVSSAVLAEQLLASKHSAAATAAAPPSAPRACRTYLLTDVSRQPPATPR